MYTYIYIYIYMNHLLDDFCIVSDHIRGMIIRAATCLQACIIVTPLRASSVRPSRQAIPRNHH